MAWSWRNAADHSSGIPPCAGPRVGGFEQGADRGRRDPVGGAEGRQIDRVAHRDFAVQIVLADFRVEITDEEPRQARLAGEVREMPQTGRSRCCCRCRRPSRRSSARRAAAAPAACARDHASATAPGSTRNPRRAAPDRHRTTPNLRRSDHARNRARSESSPS